MSYRQKTLTERQLTGIDDIVDSTGGTANGTLAAVSALSTSNTYTDAALNAKLTIINANFADLAAKFNELLQAQRKD